jgi:gliding motility-associated-like protein
LNGLVVTPANSNVTPITTGPLSIDANGILTLAPNTPSGTYTITYQLCEANPVTGLNVVPANCSTTTVTVVVVATSIIDAVNNTYPTQTPSTTVATTVGNVTSNDTLNGVLVTAANSNVTPITTGPLSIDANGVLILAPNTPSGTYTITYQLCEANPVTGLNVVPANCDTATVTVVVVSIIDAVNNTYPTQTPSTTVAITVGNVTNNDTLNGVLVTAANSNVTPITTGPLSIDANGVLTLAPNTPSGSYIITYQLCEANPVTGLNVIPANCDTATVTVVVAAPIDARNDDFTTNPINGYLGGIVGNVYSNTGSGTDTFNNLPIIPSQLVITVVNNGGIVGLTIPNNGNVIIPRGTQAGTYVVTYRICDVLNPTNCATATITIVITAPTIDAIDDLQNDVVNSQVGATIPLYANDKLNENALIPIDVVFTLVNNGGIVGAFINAAGNLIVPIGTSPGTYTITYKICDAINPNNCDTAIAIITVTCIDIIIHNAFTPNDDAFNEYFNIENIENFACYPTNKVEIYNRWGILVYETENYNNNSRRFAGISEGRVTVNKSEELPAGVYFYNINWTTANGQAVNKTGYLYLTR